jgi:lysophospholipase L1-like esterase
VVRVEMMVVAGVLVAALQAPQPAADQPVARTDENSRIAHAQLLGKARSGRIDVYFAGDSITRRWGATDYPDLLAHWRQTFFGWNAANFGWGGDTTQNILWRLENGELDGINPKVIVLQAGTNNLARVTANDDGAAVAGDVARGIRAILDIMRAKAPSATIIVTGVFPRGDRVELNPIIADINRRVAAFADGRSIRFLNVNDRLADASGTPAADVMRDGLHPTLKGYQVWADGLAPLLTTLLGPRAAADAAPSPTGDPSAAARQPVR